MNIGTITITITRRGHVKSEDELCDLIEGAADAAQPHIARLIDALDQAGYSTDVEALPEVELS